MLDDVLNTIRTLNSQVESIKNIEMSVEDRKLVNDALVALKGILLETDSALADFIEVTNVLNDRIQIIKDLNLSDEEKENLLRSLEKIRDLTDKL